MHAVLIPRIIFNLRISPNLNPAVVYNIVLIHTNDINLLMICAHISQCLYDCYRYDIVSPGEAQRISFARLFYHQPPFACECCVDLVCYHALINPVWIMMMIYSPNLASRKLFFQPNKLLLCSFGRGHFCSE